jgi:hypothetical protein
MRLTRQPGMICGICLCTFLTVPSPTFGVDGFVTDDVAGVFYRPLDGVPVVYMIRRPPGGWIGIGLEIFASVTIPPTSGTIKNVQFVDEHTVSFVNGEGVVRYLHDSQFTVDPHTLQTSQATAKSAPQAAVVEPQTVPLSHDGNVMDALCGGRFIVTGGANSATPVSLVDLEAGAEIDAVPLANQICMSVAAGDDGRTVLAVTTEVINGASEQFFVRRLAVDPAGQLADSGDELPGWAERVSFLHARCAPGSQTGLVLATSFTDDVFPQQQLELISFSLPELAIIDRVKLAKASGSAIAIDCDGNRVFTRSGNGGPNADDVVEGFGYDPLTGQISNAAALTITGIEFTNVTAFENPLAISSDGAVLFVPEIDLNGTTGQLRIFNAETGAAVDPFEDPDHSRPTAISPANCCGDVDPPPPSDSVFEKEITDGPDRNNDGETDRVVEVLSKTTSQFEFTITFRHTELAPALVRDVVPYQWEVVSCIPTNEGDVVQMSKTGFTRNRGNRATQIDWFPTDNDGSLICTVKLRLHQFAKYEPNSVGKLFLNQGACALNASTKQPLVDGEGQKLTTEQLLLIGMKDANRDKQIDWSGEGDEDGDTLSDWFEASEYGTDPTKKDTDGDRSPDNIDKEPLNRRKK